MTRLHEAINHFRSLDEMRTHVFPKHEPTARRTRVAGVRAKEKRPAGAGAAQQAFPKHSPAAAVVAHGKAAAGSYAAKQAAQRERTKMMK